MTTALTTLQFQVNGQAANPDDIPALSSRSETILSTSGFSHSSPPHSRKIEDLTRDIEEAKMKLNEAKEHKIRDKALACLLVAVTVTLVAGIVFLGLLVGAELWLLITAPAGAPFSFFFLDEAHYLWTREAKCQKTFTELEESVPRYYENMNRYLSEEYQFYNGSYPTQLQESRANMTRQIEKMKEEHRLALQEWSQVTAFYQRFKV